MYLTEEIYTLKSDVSFFVPVFLNINFHEPPLLEEPPDALKLFCLCTSACLLYITKYTGLGF